MTAQDNTRGSYLEFGVFTGSSFNFAMKVNKKIEKLGYGDMDCEFIGFDSFKGFGDVKKNDEHPNFRSDVFSVIKKNELYKLFSIFSFDFTVKSNWPDWQDFSEDIFWPPLRKFNLSNRSKFEVCDIDKFNFGKYDLIVSNPPYIPSKEIKELSKDIRSHEPEIAINGGKDGLDLIKKVIYKSSVLLKRNGLFALEIGTNQYLRVSAVMNKHGFRLVSKEFDYNNNVRCIISTKVWFFKF